MALTDSLRYLITANGAQAEREFAKVGQSARRSLGMAESASQRYSRSLTSAGVAMVTFGGVALLGLAKAAQAAEEENAALLRLQNSIQNMPELAGASTAAFLDQAAALQDTTKFADEATVSAQAMLGTFHLTEQQILDLIPAVQDYAAKFGVDLVTASKQVGRAVSGSAGALTRNGIIMDEAAFAADHYGTVLSALRENAGGFAAQEGQTLSGQMQILKNNFSDIIEAVGGGAASAFQDLLGPVKSLSGALQEMDPATQSVVGRLLTFGAVGITAVGGLALIGGAVLRTVTGLKALRDTLVAFKTASIAGFRSASSAASGLTSSMVGLGIATAGAAAVVAIGISEWQKEKETHEAGARAVNDLADAMREAGDSTGPLRDFFTNALKDAPEFTAAMAASGVTVDQLTDAALQGGHAWDSYADRILEASDGSNEVVFALKAIEENVPDAVEQSRNLGDAIGGAGGSAADAAQAIDDLTQEIQDYLAGLYDVPSAQRDLRGSFDDLYQLFLGGTGSADDYAAALEDIVTNAGDVVSAQLEQGASQEEINATIGLTRQRLLAARDANIITQEQFLDYSRDLDGITPIVRTAVETPGLTTAQTRARDLDSRYDDLDGRTVRSIVQADVERAEFDRLVRDLNAADERRFTMQVSVNDRPGAAVGRMFPLGGTTLVGERGPELVTVPAGGRVFNNAESSMRLKAAKASGGGPTTIVVPVMLDGEKIAEVIADTDRRYNVARGEMS